MQKSSRRSRVAIPLVSILLLATGLCLWMIQGLGTNELSEKLMSLQREIDCLKCAADANDDKKRCEKCPDRGKRRIKSLIGKDEFPSSCLERPDCRKNTEEMVRKKNELQKAELIQAFDDEERNELDMALEAMYQSPRIIVHWFPLQWGPSKKNNSGEIVSYERHRSTYTVSSGPEGSYDNGKLVVTNKGLYYVYAKLTFNCTEADQKLKHIGIDILLDDPSRNIRRLSILRERARAKCHMEGDLETLFQRGIFRLNKGSTLILAYETSENVVITTQDRAYKSCLGMYGVGR